MPLIQTQRVSLASKTDMKVSQYESKSVRSDRRFEKRIGRLEDSLDGHDVSSIDTEQRSYQKHIPQSMPSLRRGAGGSKAKKSLSKGRKNGKKDS